MTKVYVMAEAGSVADGSLGNMLELVKMVADCGADAFKAQDHRWEVVDPQQPHPNPRVRELRKDYYERTSFCSYDWNSIAEACKRHGVDLVVSVFSEQAAQEQASRVSAFKVASGQVTNQKLLQRLRELGKPVLMSSGMTMLVETRTAAELLGDSLQCVLACTSLYPCPPECVGLNTIAELAEWAPAVGFSDHTLGVAASLAAITLGARTVERHVTLSRRCYGSDAAHSMEPEEFRRFVEEVRALDVMLSSQIDRDELASRVDVVRMREVFLHVASQTGS